MHVYSPLHRFFFFFNDTATTEIYTLSLHDALPISVFVVRRGGPSRGSRTDFWPPLERPRRVHPEPARWHGERGRDRKSTRLNSSHGYISYAVFCLKKKKKKNEDAIDSCTRE